MNNFEVIGIIASVLVVFSMVFKTTTYRGTMMMRILNLTGSIFFIVYGFLLPAYATAITNSCALLLNALYIVKEYKDHKRRK